MTEEKFTRLVGEALDSLPEEFSEKLDNVAVVIEDVPTEYQRAKIGNKKGELLLGLYEGVPLGQRRNYSGVMPDKITIFKKAIELVADTDESVRELVRSTVMHEIGHHFGLSDEELK